MYDLLPQADVHRVEKIEFLDEKGNSIGSTSSSLDVFSLLEQWLYDLSMGFNFQMPKDFLYILHYLNLNYGVYQWLLGSGGGGGIGTV